MSACRSDAYHITSPEPTGRGQIAAMQSALKDADQTTRDIVHVNAHATSTSVGDLIEARAVRTLLGDDADHVALVGDQVDDRPPARRRRRARDRLHGPRRAPPHRTAHHQRVDPDPELDIDLVRDTPRALPEGDIAAINNSFGFGGHNVALIARSV